MWRAKTSSPDGDHWRPTPSFTAETSSPDSDHRRPNPFFAGRPPVQTRKAGEQRSSDSSSCSSEWRRHAENRDLHSFAGRPQVQVTSNPSRVDLQSRREELESIEVPTAAAAGLQFRVTASSGAATSGASRDCSSWLPPFGASRGDFPCSSSVLFVGYSCKGRLLTMKSKNLNEQTQEHDIREFEMNEEINYVDWNEVNDGGVNVDNLDVNGDGEQNENIDVGDENGDDEKECENNDNQDQFQRKKRNKVSKTHADFSKVTSKDGSIKLQCIHCKTLLSKSSSATTTHLWNHLSSLEDWSKIEHVLSILEVFYEATQVISRTNYLTSNVFLGVVWRVKHVLNEHEFHHEELIRDMNEKMKTKFDKYWGDCNLMMSIGAILDPRYKMRLIDFAFNQIYNANDARINVMKVRDALHDLFYEY
nr:zinc finger BED domain-containing protein RICESLEEPER 2-like [Ipomoea batatas]